MTSSPSANNQFFDNTRLSSYKTCPRAYDLRHNKHFRREGTALPLAFGLAWHEAMDQVWTKVNHISDDAVLTAAYEAFVTSWVEQGLKHPSLITDDDMDYFKARHPATAREMLYNYIQTRKDFIAECELLAVELPFAIPVNSDRPDLFYIGRLDKVVRHKGRVLVIEHKSTSSYRGRAPDYYFPDDYVDSWYNSSQVKGYLYASYLNNGSNAVELYIDAALVHKKEHNMFKFIPVKKSLEQLNSFVADVNRWIAKIEHDNTHGFAANEDQCMGKYSRCTFFDVCRFGANPESLTEPPEGFVVDKWEPFDVLKINEIMEK